MARKYSKYMQQLKELQEENAYLKEVIEDLNTEIEILRDSEQYYKEMYYSMVRSCKSSSGQHFHVDLPERGSYQYDGKKVSVSITPRQGFAIRFRR